MPITKPSQNEEDKVGPIYITILLVSLFSAIVLTFLY